MEANESSRVSDDLTSTAESVLTNNGHEKKINHSDSISVGDSTPSSSSDANMQTSIVKTIHDDPISSTSDSLIHENEMNLNILTSDLNFIAGVETSGSTNDIGTDSDFFTSELSIASMATEKISEDVEDIANDLENLLGETTHSYGVICTNSVVVTNTSERLKEISTSSASISGNLFIDQAEIDIAGEVISQVEISSDNLEGKNQVLASKDAHFCINSDVLEANKKTECTVEYSSVDILNSDGEVTHTEVSRFTQVEDFSQSAYSSKEANDEGNALSVGQLDLNIANIETDSLQKEGEEEISADKDLNEETDRNQKISENKPNSTQTLVTNEEDENALVPGKASSEVLRECEVDVFQEMIGVDKKDASNVDNAETIDDNELKTLPAMETLEHIETNKEVQEAEMDLMETGDENVMGVGENIEDTTPTTLMVEEKNCELEFSSNQAQVEDESSERVVDNVDAVVFTTVEQVIAENDATQSEFYKQQTLIELQDDNMENITTSKSADKIIDEESAMEVTEAVEFMETEEILQPDEQKGVDETDIPQTHEERKEECEVIQQEASGREEGEVNPLEGTSSNVSSAISPRENLSKPDEEHESKDTVVPSETVKDLETSDEVPNLDSNVPVEIKEDIEIAPSGSTPELVEHMEEGNMIVGSDEFTNKEEEEEREKELISTQTEAVMDAENFDAESFNLSTNTEAALPVELDNEDTATNAGQMQGLEDSPRNKSEDAVIEAAVADLSEEVRLTSENVAAPEFKENVASSEEIAVDVPKDDLDETNNSELPVSHQSDIIQTENKCPEETNEGLFVLEIQETAKSENVDMAKCVERNSSDQEAADTLLIKSGEVDVEPLEKNVEVIENLEESNKQMSTNEIDEIVDDKTAEAVNDVEMPLEGDTAELEIKTSTTENNEELTEISEMPETATASERHEEGDDVPSKSKLVDLIQEETLDNDEQICSNTPFTDAILSTEFNEIAETEVNKSEAVCDIQMNEESSLNLESCEVAEIDKVPVELPMDDSNIQDHLNIKEPTTEDKNLDALDATEIVDHDVAKENVEVDNKNDDLIMQESDDASAANAIQEDMQEPDKIMQDEAQENTEEFENKNIEPNVAELEPATEAITLEENTEGNENPDLEEDLEEPKIEPITEDSNEVSEDIAVLPQDDIEMLPDSSIENQTQEPKSDPSIAEIEDVDENLQQTVGGLLDATLPLTPEDPQPTADDIVQPVELK
ncbi:hypothetical protein QE152_g21625 [Popillia japonica]|uniref:Uncharacterized protein n=1 Tax=Popillia japonica TaxID=7064 RepID=A0AAW1KNY1_POPJA